MPLSVPGPVGGNATGGAAGVGVAAGAGVFAGVGAFVDDAGVVAAARVALGGAGGGDAIVEGEVVEGEVVEGEVGEDGGLTPGEVALADPTPGTPGDATGALGTTDLAGALPGATPEHPATATTAKIASAAAAEQGDRDAFPRALL